MIDRLRTALASGRRARVVTLVLLGILGAGLAVTGTVLGVGDRGAEFTVSESGVTVSDGSTTATVVENMTNVTAVEIAADGDGFSVDTERARPITAEQRTHAVEIARTNETLRPVLDDEHEFVVEPVQRLDSDAAFTGNASGIEGTGDTFKIDFEVDSAESTSGNSVTVRRQSTYVEDEVAVRVLDSDTGTQLYSLLVDLSTERVVSLTNWQTTGSE